MLPLLRLLLVLPAPSGPPPPLNFTALSAPLVSLLSLVPTYAPLLPLLPLLPLVTLIPQGAEEAEGAGRTYPRESRPLLALLLPKNSQNCFRAKSPYILAGIAHTSLFKEIQFFNTSRFIAGKPQKPKKKKV